MNRVGEAWALSRSWSDGFILWVRAMIATTPCPGYGGETCGLPTRPGQMRCERHFEMWDR